MTERKKTKDRDDLHKNEVFIGEGFPEQLVKFWNNRYANNVDVPLTTPSSGSIMGVCYTSAGSAVPVTKSYNASNISQLDTSEDIQSFLQR